MREVLPSYPGAIVSQSFGADETGPASDPSSSATFSRCTSTSVLRGGTVLAASGDLGASNGTELGGAHDPRPRSPSPMAAYPASDPLVLSVGGTEGNPPDGLVTDSGTYGAEQAWNEIFNGQPGAGGGAPSAIFDAPPWQRSLKTKDRLEPDVSYNAAANGGVFVVLSCPPDRLGGVDRGAVQPGDPHYDAVGGTSAGTPQWAAIIALANEVRASQARAPLGLVEPAALRPREEPAHLQPGLPRHHVRQRTRSTLSAFGVPAVRSSASRRPGYDLATGLGTPERGESHLRPRSRGGSGEIPGNLRRFFKQDDKDHGNKHHRFDPSK